MGDFYPKWPVPQAHMPEQLPVSVKVRQRQSRHCLEIFIGLRDATMAAASDINSGNPSRDEATLEFYAREAPVYAASGPDGISRHLNGFLQHLRQGANILELGCGGGRDSEAMLARGFEVDATDGVPEIARHAQKRIGREVRVMRFDELDAVERYDAVWAHASLLHVPRVALPAILSSILRALRPGGLHFANFKGGGSEARDRFGRYFNYLTADEVVGAYQQSGRWEILTLNEYVGGGYDGRQGPWVAITVRKPSL